MYFEYISFLQRHLCQTKHSFLHIFFQQLFHQYLHHKTYWKYYFQMTSLLVCMFVHLFVKLFVCMLVAFKPVNIPFYHPFFLLTFLPTLIFGPRKGFAAPGLPLVNTRIKACIWKHKYLEIQHFQEIQQFKIFVWDQIVFDSIAVFYILVHRKVEAY